MNYVQQHIATNREWRATPRASTSRMGVRLAARNRLVGNGASVYGELKAGTLIACDSAGDYHPVGIAATTAPAVATAQITVDNAAGFYVGDQVVLRSGADRPTDISIGGQSFHVWSAPYYPTASLKIVVAGDNTPLSWSSDVTAITINAATDGGGAVTTTFGELERLLLHTFGRSIRATQYDRVALKATPIAARAGTTLSPTLYAVLPGALGKIGTGPQGEPQNLDYTIIAKDGPTLTLDATVSCAAGDLLVKGGALTEPLILDETVTTLTYLGTTASIRDVTANAAYEGDARNSARFLPNLGTGAAADFARWLMSGRPYPNLAFFPDGGSVLGASVVDLSPSVPLIAPNRLVGFRFLDV